MSRLKFLMTCLFIICLHQFGTAQVLSTSLIKEGSGLYFNNKQTYFYKTLELTSFDSIRKVSGSNFQLLKDQSVIYLGFDQYYYWFRFVIENIDTTDHSLIFIPGGLGTREAELWQESKGRSSLIGKNGYKYPFHKRPYPFTQHSFILTIKAGNKDTFYLGKNENHAYKSFAFAFIDPKEMHIREHRLYFFFGFIIGLLLFFALINFYLFYSVKEKIHLWYALYLITMSFFLVKHDGLDAEFLNLDSVTGYRLTPMLSFGTLSMGLLTQVVQLFLNPAIDKKFISKVLSVIKWLAWVGGFLFFIIFWIEPHFIIERIAFGWANYANLAAAVAIMIACSYSLKSGFKPALFILVGMSLFLIGVVLNAAFLSMQSLLFPIHLFQIGLVVEAIVISFGLMYRYNQFKKEKDALKGKLELQQIEAGREIVRTQEEEQKRIARDLHDELGGNLAAIKMTLASFDLPDTQSQVLTQLIDKASDNTRNIAHNLMPPEFEKTNLTDLLNDYYARNNSENGINFKFHSSGNNRHFTKEQELMIYRIMMELTHNIIKHSAATEATLQLIYHENHLEMMAEDNGSGFSEKRDEGLGLKNIKSRVNYLNGNLMLDSGKKGTTIMIQIPFINPTP